MDDYSTEPRLIFSPLNEEQYCNFYSIEMESNTSDFRFYTKGCTSQLSVLELGCGNGRITHAIAETGADSIGLDISLYMIKLAKKIRSNAEFIHGDMSSFSLNRKFDRIHIPYNTLNLLNNTAAIQQCLKASCDHLKSEGTFLAQIFIPSRKLIEQDGEHIFQFQLFDTEDYGKLVKETIRTYYHKKQSMTLEERYRVRPLKGDRQDLSHTMNFHAYNLQCWKILFHEAGFKALQLFSSPSKAPYNEENSNSVFVMAKKSV